MILILSRIRYKLGSLKTEEEKISHLFVDFSDAAFDVRRSQVGVGGLGQQLRQPPAVGLQLGGFDGRLEADVARQESELEVVKVEIFDARLDLLQRHQEVDLRDHALDLLLREQKVVRVFT